MEQGDGVEDPGRIARGDVEAPGQLCAHRHEDRVEGSFGAFGLDVLHRVLEPDVDAEGDDPLDLRIEDVAGEAVGGNAESHHSPERDRRVDQAHVVAEAAQTVRAAEPGRTASDHEDALAGVGPGRG